MASENKGFSLRWGLLGIVVGCWVVPMALILGSLAYYTTQSVRRQFYDTVQASISNAAVAGRRLLREAVAASRNASYDSVIRDAYQKYMLTENKQALYESLSWYLNQKYRYDDNFLATMLFFTEDTSNIYYTFNTSLNASYSSNVLEYQRDVHEKVMRLSKNLDTRIAFVNSNDNIYMVRNIVDRSFNPYAVIVMQLNTDLLFGSFRNIVWETGATVFLNGVPVNISSGSSGDAWSEVLEGVNISSGEQIVVDTSDSIRVFGRESTDAVEMLYAVEVDMQGFIKGFFSYTGISYTLLFLSIPLLGLAVWFFYKNIFMPIDRLTAAAGKIQDGSLGYKVEGYVGNKEFTYLNEAFDIMSVRLKKLFERIYSEELALRDARIMALQSQINPHFLNNTLEIINWEVRLGNNAKVSKMIESLAIMLDAAMDRKSSPLVTLAQEMMYVDAYLYIISERFGKRLTVKNEMDPSLLQYKVPRLIMQPIIENAVEHGAGAVQSGVIILLASRDGDTMTLGVKNNRPMSVQDAKIVERLLSPDYDARGDGSLHLGIHNVNLRLKMIYGDDYGLSITSGESDTTASFSIPINSDEFVFRQ